MEAAQKSQTKAVCMPDKCGLAEHKMHHWVIDIDPKLTVDEILDPGYWAHLTNTYPFEPLDEITARWEDGTRVVKMIVRYCERTYAKVKVTSVEELGDVISEIPMTAKKHVVEWKGPVHKYSVIRLSDKVIIQDGFREREAANAWLVEHERM